MRHEEARIAAARLLRDNHRQPSAYVAYVYCSGKYAVCLRTDDGDYVLLDSAALKVYRTTHRPAEGG